MPFNEALVGTEQLHIPYHDALGRFADGWILPGHDGNPPDQFYTSADVVKQTDLATINFDALVTQPFTVHQFIFRGSADPALSDYPDFVANTEQCIGALATCAVSPSGSPVTINFLYEGSPVLSTPISLGVGATPAHRYYQTAFSIATLVPPNQFDFVGSLVAQIVSTDSGNTAANLSAALITQRIA